MAKRGALLALFVLLGLASLVSGTVVDLTDNNFGELVGTDAEKTRAIKLVRGKSWAMD